MSDARTAAIEVAAAARSRHRFAQDYGMRREYMDCMCGERILVLGADDPWEVFERHRAAVSVDAIAAADLDGIPLVAALARERADEIHSGGFWTGKEVLVFMRESSTGEDTR